MSTFAVGPRPQTEIPGEARSHMLESRLKHLGTGPFVTSALERLLVGHSAGRFKTGSIHGQDQPAVDSPELTHIGCGTQSFYDRVPQLGRMSLQGFDESRIRGGQLPPGMQA